MAGPLALAAALFAFCGTARRGGVRGAPVAAGRLGVADTALGAFCLPHAP